MMKGQCLCGNITFQVSAPLKFVAHCHCSLCRRAHGAAFVTWLGVKREQFQILSGAHCLSEFQSTPEAIRSFCNRCGSPLFFTSTKWAGEIHIARAHFIDSIEQLPKSHVFYSDKVDWFECNDKLIRYGGKTGLEPISREP